MRFLVALALVSSAALAQGVAPAGGSVNGQNISPASVVATIVDAGTVNAQTVLIPTGQKICLDVSCNEFIGENVGTVGAGNVALGSAGTGNFWKVVNDLVVGQGESVAAQFSGALLSGAFALSSGSPYAFTTGTAARAIVDTLGNYTQVASVPRRSGAYQTITSTDTSFTAIGIGAASAINGGGTCTPAADTTDTAYQMIKFPTDAASTGHACGQAGPFTTTEATYLPLAYWVVRTDPAAITTTRVYVGFGASSLDQVATLAGANTIKGCWFRYDTGLSDANWTAESSDGTTASATDTTIAYAAATTFSLLIDNHVSGTCDFYVNGVLKVHKTSNVNNTSTALGLEHTVTTLASSARALSVSKVILLQN